MKRITYIFAIVLFAQVAQAQDIHWSQFNDNQVFQNPGNVGQFNGDIRFIGNYRDQWRSVTVPFSTISVSVDSKLYNHKNFGYGLLLFHDVAGDGKFRTIEAQANASYLLKLTSDSTHTIRPGFNVGINNRQLSFDQLYFGNQFNGMSYDPSISSGEVLETNKNTNLSIGFGTIYQYYKNERFNFTGGIGLYNINRPNQGFYNAVVERDIRLNVFGKGIYKLNYDWDLVPGMEFSLQGKYREFIIGSSVKYTLVDRLGEYRAVYGGLFYRNRDAAYLSAGFDYQAWFFGVSYDINFSKLVPASRTRGGLELAVRYIMFRFKPKKIVHRICPDYI